jgi:subtilase family serine protease
MFAFHLKCRPKHAALAAAVALVAVGASSISPARADPSGTSLQFSVMPPSQVGAEALGVTNPSKSVHLDFVLKPRDESDLARFAHDVSTPGNKLYGHYLTPQEFKDRYGPTDDQVADVKAYVVRHGFVVDSVSPNNMIVRAHATIGQIDSALGITLKDYWDPVAARTYHCPDSEPILDAPVAPLLASIAGLSNKAVPRSFSHTVNLPTVAVPAPHGGATGLKKVVGPGQLYITGHKGLSPSDTSTIYDMTPVVNAGYNGAGQVLGLFELGTTTPSYANTWESYYGVRTVPQTIISVDGYNTNSKPGGASGEYTLDVEMLQMWASGANGMRIYEANDNYSSDDALCTEFTDAFTDMATDSVLPNVISVSYGISELDVSTDDLIAEWIALLQLDTQGQSVFCAAGDAGAWADQSYPMSDPNLADPGSEPLLVSVGGTFLTDNSSLQYVSESSWFDSNDTGRGQYGTGGGGGVSQVWSIPDFQVGSFSTSVNPQGSTSMRNGPDVSLFGDYDEGGYDTYFGGWGSTNGTSASSPLWAGYAAVVNQERELNGQPDLGFADPAFYAAAESRFYPTAFHDIADDSTNGYYAAVPGYDNTTGWGSFDAANLLLPLASIFVSTAAGDTQFGTQLNPFGSVAQAADAAGMSPTTQVFISPGSYSEDITISKAVTLNAYGNGTVTIGTQGN